MNIKNVWSERNVYFTYLNADDAFKKKLMYYGLALAIGIAATGYSYQYKEDTASRFASQQSRYLEMQNTIREAGSQRAQIDSFLQQQTLKLAKPGDVEAINRDMMNLITVHNLQIAGIKPLAVPPATNQPNSNNQQANAPTTPTTPTTPTSQGQTSNGQQQAAPKFMVGEIGVKGSYEAVVRFINAVDEQLPWLCSINHVDIEAQNNGQVMTKITYKVYLY